jgi:hypothetical protein
MSQYLIGSAALVGSAAQSVSRRGVEMSKYSIEAPLKSCFLSKDTVERLEKYVFDKAASINQLALENVREDYQIESIDSLGTETLRSIHEHGRHQFYNDTRRLVLTYRRYHDKLTTLKISFGLSELWSTIEVTMDGPNARETAMEITHDVQMLLKSHANLNFIFYGKYAVLPFIAFGVSAGVLPVLFNFKASEALKVPNAWIALSIVAFWALFVAVKKINPYVLFDTRENERTQQSFGWVLKVLCGVVVLGGIAKLIVS